MMTTEIRIARAAAFEALEKLEIPTLIGMRMGEIESGFNVDAVSRTGCVGLWQINPRDSLTPGYGILSCYNALDTTHAAAYLNSYMCVARRIHGSWGKAALAWNVGMHGDQRTASLKYRQLANYVDLC